MQCTTLTYVAHDDATAESTRARDYITTSGVLQLQLAWHADLTCKLSQPQRPWGRHRTRVLARGENSVRASQAAWHARLPASLVVSCSAAPPDRWNMQRSTGSAAGRPTSPRVKVPNLGANNWRSTGSTTALPVTRAKGEITPAWRGNDRCRSAPVRAST